MQALKRKDERREGGENRRGSRSGRAVASYSKVVWQKSSILFAQARGSAGEGGACSQQKFFAN